MQLIVIFCRKNQMLITFLLRCVKNGWYFWNISKQLNTIIKCPMVLQRQLNKQIWEWNTHLPKTIKGRIHMDNLIFGTHFMVNFWQMSRSLISYFMIFCILFYFFKQKRGVHLVRSSQIKMCNNSVFK